MRLKTLLVLALMCALTSCSEFAYAQSLGPAVGNITSAGASCSLTSTPTNCVSLHLDGMTGAATIQLSGTFTATIQFEVSNDNGATWAAINATPPNSTTAVTSATSTGIWQLNVAGFTDIRARGSAYTSGTAAVVINSGRVSARSGGGAVFASGGTTNGQIPKSNGSGQLVDGSLNDGVTNANTVTATNPILFPAGTIGAPGVQFAEATANAGITRVAVNTYDFSIGNSIASVRFAANVSAGSLVVNKTLGIASTNPNTTVADVFLSEKAGGSMQLGAPDAAAPVAQTFGPQSVVTGTSNIAGARWTLRPSLGTGNAAGAAIAIQRALMLGAGTTQQSATDGFVIGETKTLSNTSATAQVLANISVPSNSAGGVEGTINVNCTDATNFDSETQSFNTSFVNKAGTVTVTAPVITATSAANNSGSCTAGITAVANGNGVDIKVTPVFTTIVPTTVTGTVVKLSVVATGNVTIN